MQYNDFIEEFKKYERKQQRRKIYSILAFISLISCAIVFWKSIDPIVLSAGDYQIIKIGDGSISMTKRLYKETQYDFHTISKKDFDEFKKDFDEFKKDFSIRAKDTKDTHVIIKNLDALKKELEELRGNINQSSNIDTSKINKFIDFSKCKFPEISKYLQWILRKTPNANPPPSDNKHQNIDSFKTIDFSKYKFPEISKYLQWILRKTPNANPPPADNILNKISNTWLFQSSRVP